MIIYNNNLDNIHVNLYLEKIPAKLVVNIHDIDYSYTIYGEPIDSPSKYDKQIKTWVDDNKEIIRDIVWEWNMNRPVPMIDKPLKL